MGTYYLYFPFFARKVKFGARSIEAVDRLNVHCMGMAARAVFELPVHIELLQSLGAQAPPTDLFCHRADP